MSVFNFIESSFMKKLLVSIVSLLVISSCGMQQTSPIEIVRLESAGGLLIDIGRVDVSGSYFAIPVMESWIETGYGLVIRLPEGGVLHTEIPDGEYVAAINGFQGALVKTGPMMIPKDCNGYIVYKGAISAIIER